MAGWARARTSITSRRPDRMIFWGSRVGFDVSTDWKGWISQYTGFAQAPGLSWVTWERNDDQQRVGHAAI